MSNHILTLTDISKSYRQGNITVEVLKQVNLTIAEGELVAIIGASGSGKSTLLHIAGLLDKADSGTVQIAQEYYQQTMNAKTRISTDLIRLQYLGFVYQYHHLLNNFTARENVAMPALIAGAKYEEALQAADQLLETLNLSNRKNNLPGELSGGEQQRVAIARSLINKPKLILADEPTGNLDPHTANEVFNLFVNRASEQGTAIIMVTHNHNLARNMHKIFELKNTTLTPVAN
ncbi:ABC transporter ATP-binding protein [Candidatus Trichorickettsia mobilis]|uniref:ABC transporter ATP-binding protein n=1 Tax=Candidatus Trichorickettsia mobilis TaxID=1346319 RepID=UPI00292F37E6|nr:ABC transporter ATP-binding protein [Candidatus Trichorickettsia mobilis]